jgi:hypothetical protein
MSYFQPSHTYFLSPHLIDKFTFTLSIILILHNPWQKGSLLIYYDIILLRSSFQMIDVVFSFQVGWSIVKGMIRVSCSCVEQPNLKIQSNLET